MERPSKSFQWDEFIVSAEHQDLAAKIELTDADRLKIFYLCRLFLQPVRDRYGVVRILSGKRSPELNEKIGGADTSDHLFQGECAAVDFTVPGAKLADIYAWLGKVGSFGQLIYYPSQSFIHVSLPSQKHYFEAFRK